MGNAGEVFWIYDYEATSLYWNIERHPDAPSPDEFWTSDESYEFHLAATAEVDSFRKWLGFKIGLLSVDK